MVASTAIVIAHNAAFDRPFCERIWPIFAAKPWACSLREVGWKAEGFEGTKLRDIAAGHGARPVTALQTPGDAQQRVERRDLDPDQPRAPGMDGEFPHSRDRRGPA